MAQALPLSLPSSATARVAALGPLAALEPRELSRGPGEVAPGELLQPVGERLGPGCRSLRRCPRAIVVQHHMERAIELEVPIEVEIGVGQNWLEAH